MRILDFISTFIKFQNYPFELEDDDGLVEKLSRKYTAIIIFIFSILVGVAKLVGNTIECWCPLELKGLRCQYAKSYCYLTGTYIPIGNKTELPSKNELMSHQIRYYQWIPYLFVLLSFLLYVPYLIWKYFSSKSGFELKNYIRSLRTDSSDISNSSSVKYVTNHIRTTLDFQKNYRHRGIFPIRFLTHGIYLNICYFGVKLMYGFIVFMEIFLMNYWFRDSFYSNVGFFETIFGKHNLNLSERFPRTTLCRFEVYILNEDQRNWVQCTLPINVYLEKIYLILWTWLWVLFVIIVVDILWSAFLFLRSTSFIKERVDDKYRQRILLDNLSKDGVLMLRLIKSNTNDFYVRSILSCYSNLLSFKYK